jgi:hypothetical protein
MALMLLLLLKRIHPGSSPETAEPLGIAPAQQVAYRIELERRDREPGYPEWQFFFGLTMQFLN